MAPSISACPFPASPVRLLAGVFVVCCGVSGMVACRWAAADDASSAGDARPRLPPHATLVWREDPRPAADTPGGVEVPSGRRVPRRVQRRAARRRPTPDAQSAVQPDALQPEALPIDALTIDGQPMDAQPRTRLDAAPPLVTTPDLSRQPAPVAAPEPDAISTTSSGITTHRDQPYAAAGGRPAHGRQRFDIHLPAGCNAGGMPLVVWIHGDTWRDGSKSDCPLVWLASEGYAVASIGYRLSDAAVFPAQLDDCRAAIAEIERHADVWGIDPDRVAVVGSGGGGHLAALVGLAGQLAISPATSPATSTATSPATAPATGPDRPDHDPDEETAAIRIAAVCAVAAPASLTTLGPEQDRAGSPASRLVGGPLPEFREAAQRASPVSHVSADDPPVLLLHGAADRVIPASQAVEFATVLKAAGVDATLVVIPGAGHSPDLRMAMPAGQALLSFLDRVLGPGVRPDRTPRP